MPDIKSCLSKERKKEKKSPEIMLFLVFVSLFCQFVFLKHKVRVAWRPLFAGPRHTLCKVWRCDTQPGETKVWCCCGVFAQAGLQRVL